MQMTIQFDPASDNLSETLDLVARGFGTTLEAFCADGNAVDEPDAYDSANLRPWNVGKAQRVLQALSQKALKGVVLVVVAGTVKMDHMEAYLGVTGLRGVFSSVGAAVRNTRGLEGGTKVIVSDYFERTYSMNKERRALFLKVLQNMGHEDLITMAREYQAQLDGIGTRKKRGPLS